MRQSPGMAVTLGRGVYFGFLEFWASSPFSIVSVQVPSLAAALLRPECLPV